MPGATATISADTPTAAAPASAPAQRQATQIRHALNNVRIISACYVINGGLLMAFVLAGTVHWVPVAAFTAMGLLVGAFWTLVFRRGWSLAFEDPHLPMSMSFSHQVLQVVGMVLMPQLSFLFLLLLFLVFISLAMRVSRRQATTAFVVICVGVALALGITGEPVRIPERTRLEQWLAWGFVSLTLWQCIWLGSYNSAMTARLKQRRRELAGLTRRVHHLAHHDELTGLLNRRSVLSIVADEQRRSDRTGAPLTIALLDLDHFKAINDTLGHAAGDRTLRVFATTVQQLVRTTDRFGRYGGEEFLAILTGTPVESARIPIERFREALKARGWDDVAADLDVTFSCGLAEYRAGESTEDLIKRADDALYLAKGAGRNCTRAA
jgi:diguanylate cyclase (GGDEF)-like protein